MFVFGALGWVGFMGKQEKNTELQYLSCNSLCVVFGTSSQYILGKQPDMQVFFFMILTHLKSPRNFLNYIPIICEAISRLASSLPSKHMLRYNQSLPSIPGKNCFTPHRRKIQESFFGWWFQPTQLKNLIVKLDQLAS